MTRHEGRVPHADTRFNLNPLDPIACSERTYSKMYEPEYADIPGRGHVQNPETPV